jgi:hypothetical protein
MALRPLAVALLALTGLGWGSEARADVITVNTTADTVGAAGCPALCTIRNAISAAAGNGNSADDVIVVPAGVYVLNPQLGTLAVPTGATRITIQGAGANATFIQPNVESPMRTLSLGANAEVTLRDVTVRNGRVVATGEIGGNIWAQSGATLSLLRSRVSNGSAPRGGGIGITAGGSASSLVISASLVDGNSATTSGGGISIEGATTDVAATITDSTITGNTADNGGGIGVVNNAGTDPILRGVTLTRNRARTTAIGGIYSASTSARIQGSIIGGNTGSFVTGSGTTQFPANCGLNPAAIDEGGNVSHDATDQCGLGGEHADPQLAAALDGSQPPVLTLPANSPAIDIADCGGRTLDQRGVTRPQLGGCDAGAYEYQPPPPEPTPTPTPPVVVPTPIPTAGPTPVPTAVAGRSVGVQPSGRVRVRLPGSKTFVPLGEGVLPNGAQVDTRDGAVVITRSDGGRARFFDGIFRIGHSRGITTLTLTQALAPCPKGRASAAQKRKPKTRKLWGSGKGKFRTKGRYSAATVRGTKWLVQDGCRYTRTRVTQGSVLVRDTVRKRNIVVRKGKSYVARPRR